MSLSEFQVVILAGGFGKHLNPLVEETPKQLLPVCNRPLLSYQLEMIENAGFTDVFIFTRESSGDQLRHYTNEVYRGKLKIELTELADYVGTGQALLRLKEKLKKDIIVVNGDLIAESTFIHAMVDRHRARDAALTVLLKEKPADDPAQASVAPGGRKRSKGTDICGIEPQTGRLVLLASSEDFQSSFKVKRSLLMKFPNMVLHTNLLDPHVYIISRWTLDWYEKQSPEKRHKGDSLRHDIIPALLRSQYAEISSANVLPHDPALNSSNAMDAAGTGNPKVPSERLMASSRFDPNDRVFCQAFQLDSKPLCIRANNMATFMDANRDIATGTKFFKPLEKPGKGNFIAESAVISPKTQVGTECVVSDSTTIGDRCGIKKSVIGKHCVIGNNVKIANSVLLDHVTVKDGTDIRNCVICSNTYVNENAELIDCAIGPKCTIPAGEKIKKETVTDRNDSQSESEDDDEM